MIVKQEVLWCHRNANTHYTGGYPNGYMNDIETMYGIEPDAIHLFSGTVKNGIGIDFNPILKPKICADAQYIPLRDNSVPRIYADPPYDENYTQHYTDLRPHQPRTKSKYSAYGFIKECARILKPGGLLIILHWLVVPSQAGLKFERMIPVHNGPNHRIRAATVLRKPGHLPTLHSFESAQPLIRTSTEDKNNG